jgi:hypothetical protein
VRDFSQPAARAAGPEHHNEAPRGAFVARTARGCTGCTLHVLCSPLLSYRRGIEGGGGAGVTVVVLQYFILLVSAASQCLTL